MRETGCDQGPDIFDGNLVSSTTPFNSQFSSGPDLVVTGITDLGRSCVDISVRAQHELFPHIVYLSVVPGRSLQTVSCLPPPIEVIGTR